ncbi:hypothetical protein [Winogradskyella sp. PG-2]|uniref:hypothetical protein n=1 Tax=Winogradskyella sp. PG-2 TaxID=754409 RepID=UPI0004585E67|nr:hypothetical protein [Winogradskyella sp. PG-2]BAO77612.1 hypothetical protein WPG_3382 [Winogradskyella sp. PG-2]
MILTDNISKLNHLDNAIKLNDVVKTINGKTFNETTYCEFYDNINTLLQEDKTIVLIVVRNGKPIQFSIDKALLF